MSKNVVETEGPQMTTLMAHTRCMLDKQGYMHIRVRTHRPGSNTYCFSTSTMIRECALMLRHTYIACLVYFYIALTTIH